MERKGRKHQAYFADQISVNKCVVPSCDNQAQPNKTFCLFCLETYNRIRRKNIQKQCERCKIPLPETIRNSRQKYCKDCYKQVNKEAARDRRRDIKRKKFLEGNV